MYWIYATPEAFEWLDRSNLTTMRTLVNDAFGDIYGHSYMQHLTVSTFYLPAIIFVERYHALTPDTTLICIGSYDPLTEKGRNAYELTTMQEVVKYAKV